MTETIDLWVRFDPIEGAEFESVEPGGHEPPKARRITVPLELWYQYDRAVDALLEAEDALLRAGGIDAAGE